MPTRLKAVSSSPTSVELSWRAADDASKYVIRVGTERSLDDETVKVTSAKTTVTIDDLPATTPGTDLYYRVEAVDGDETTTSRTARFALAPGAMPKVKVATRASDGVKLTWKAVANARQYDVLLASDAAFADVIEGARTVAAEPTYIASSLAPDTDYWFKIRPVSGDTLGAYGAPVKVHTRAEAASFTVGTWNVCSEKCKGYTSRGRIMAQFLNEHRLDMFGLQEAGGERVGRTTNALFSGHSQGYVRATGGAKARYIFFRPSVFTQVSGGYFSIGDGRHTTWGRFKVNATGREFFFVDVHLENGHGNDGKRARESRAMIGRMNAINADGLPMIYAGDFNSGRHRGADSPGRLMNAAGMTDAVDLAKRPVNRHINTGHTFGTGILASGAHVDHIFVSREFTVSAWEQMIRASGGRYVRPVVSDHNPLKSTVVLGGQSASIGEPTATAPIPVDDLDTP